MDATDRTASSFDCCVIDSDGDRNTSAIKLTDFCYRYLHLLRRGETARGVEKNRVERNLLIRATSFVIVNLRCTLGHSRLVPVWRSPCGYVPDPYSARLDLVGVGHFFCDGIVAAGFYFSKYPDMIVIDNR
jgi:hypothetical protein